jgi:hypothetical protein
MQSPLLMPEAGPVRISLPNLGIAVRWLSEHGVSTNRLASALGIKPGYIRLLRHRASPLHFNTPGDSVTDLLARPTARMRERLGVRPHEDSVATSRRSGQRLDELEHEIESIWEAHARSGRFQEGLTALRSYQALRGYPSSARWLRFSARLHQHRAWFRGHGGMSRSAFEEAKMAIDLSHLAYKEKEDPLDLRRLTESCLIASNACVLGSDPAAALKMLDLAAQASERISDPLGSEYYRQRGTACFQLSLPGDTPQVREYFESATVAMERKQEYGSKGQLMMAGDRHLALLGTPDVALSAGILEQVEKDFGPGSLQRVMMLNWTAACALATDSPELHTHAKQLLQAARSQSAPYGHQDTCAYLLALTTEVGLDPRFWRAWIHQALYGNVYRTQ